MKRNLVAIIFIAVLFTALGVYVGSRHIVGEHPNRAVETLFSISLPDTGGKLEKLANWKGKALVVNFWAPWCAPCVEEMPELSDLQREVASRGIQIIGIGIDSLPNITAFADKYKINYPVYVGGMEATELSRQLGNKAGGLPFTLLINPDGSIKKTYLGRLNIHTLRQDLLSLPPSNKT